MRLRRFWTSLRSSLWFVPTLIVLALIALGFGLIEIDQEMHSRLAEYWPRFFAAGPDGSRAMLSALATAMMTVAGVVFSITIVALAQASTQYSPRVLRNFMRDRGTQVVLGSFVGIFAYCLVVLRNIISDSSGGFVPALAVLVGFVFAIVGVGLLIYFIHHIASSIQASDMIHAITLETLDVIESMYPQRSGGNRDEQRRPDGETSEHQLDDHPWHPVPARSFGYIQSVDMGVLFRIACERRIVLRMAVGIGEFAVQNRPLVWMCRADCIDEPLVRQINSAYAIDAYRTVDQDPGFGIRQLVDIAVKALSPGVNDTTTAVTAVDYLSQVVCQLAQRPLEPRHRFSGQDLRIIARGLTYRNLVEQAFDQIIENTRGNEAITLQLIESLRRIADVTSDPDRRTVLLEQVQAAAGLTRRIQSKRLRRRIEHHAADLRRSLEKPQPITPGTTVRRSW